MTLWGGRFGEAMSATTWEFTTDDSDRRLLEVDIRGSIAHAGMLGKQGIVTEDEASTLVEALEQILADARDGLFEFAETDEDVHTAVERQLREKVGDVAGKVHTGRSRNDQVALDLRLYLMDAGRARQEQTRMLALTLVDLAEEHAATVIPTYTHLQQAQSTTLGDHLLAYAWMLLRDRERFADCVRRLAVSPLGAGASAGSSLPLERARLAEELGLSGAIPNTLDAVASRDFVAEYTFACAQTMVHLSRLAEEIVLWTTREFGWARLADEVSTGSSAMPHKKNPDIAELVRGRSATVAGDVAAILGLQKGLPLTYNRDLQEDKRIVFHADDTLAGALPAMDLLLRGLTFDPPAPSSDTTSLDLAEQLVRRGVPFREAHQAVGRLVLHLDAAGRSMSNATEADLIEADPRFGPGDIELLRPEHSIRLRRVTERVRTQIEELLGRLG